MNSSDGKIFPRKVRKGTFIGLVQLERAGVFQGEDTRRLGISQPTLSRLLARGSVKRIGRGFYAHRSSKLDPRWWPFAMACYKFGYRSTICGPSALYFHDLIPDPPPKIWIIVDKQQKTMVKGYRCLRIQTNPDIGVKQFGQFRITNLERTLVECLKYSSKIGKELAETVLRNALADRLTTKMNLIRMSGALGFYRVQERILLLED